MISLLPLALAACQITGAGPRGGNNDAGNHEVRTAPDVVQAGDRSNEVAQMGPADAAPGEDVGALDARGDDAPVAPRDGSGLLPGAGWHELSAGTTGEDTCFQCGARNVCPPDGFGGGSYNFTENCRGIFAWGSAIADLRRNRLIVWGGGHNDYYGNELYALDLNRATPTFVRLNDPTVPNNFGGNMPIPAIPPGTNQAPNSRHPYGGIAYIEHADTMFVFGGAPASSIGGTSADTWTLDLGTLPTAHWVRRDPVAGTGPDYFVTATAYDPVSRTVLVADTRALYRYTLESNRYDRLNDSAATDYHMSAAIDPVRRLLVLFGGGQLRGFSIADGSTYAMQNWDAAPGCAGLLKSYPGVAFDPTRNRFVGYPGSGGTVYLFDPDAKACTSIDMPSAPATAPDTGVEGRFRYFPALNAFAYYADYDKNAWLLRLP